MYMMVECNKKLAGDFMELNFMGTRLFYILSYSSLHFYRCKIGGLGRRREIEIDEQNFNSTHDCHGRNFLMSIAVN